MLIGQSFILSPEWASKKLKTNVNEIFNNLRLDSLEIANQNNSYELYKLSLPEELGDSLKASIKELSPDIDHFDKELFIIHHLSLDVFTFYFNTYYSPCSNAQNAIAMYINGPLFQNEEFISSIKANIELSHNPVYALLGKSA